MVPHGGTGTRTFREVSELGRELASLPQIAGTRSTADVPPGRDLSGFRLVVVPNLYLLKEPDAERLTDFVRGGGHLLVSFFSGIVDDCDRVHLGGYPAPLREVLGLRVEEFWPLAEQGTVDVRHADGTVSRADLWPEAVVPEGARSVADFDRPVRTGRAVSSDRAADEDKDTHVQRGTPPPHVAHRPGVDAAGQRPCHHGRPVGVVSG